MQGGGGFTLIIIVTNVSQMEEIEHFAEVWKYKIIKDYTCNF